MSDAIIQFFAAWGMEDAAARATSIRDSVAPAFHYLDPRTPEPISSFDDLVAYVAMYTQYAPGASAEVRNLSETSGHFRATVAFCMADGQVQMGQYFIECDTDNRPVRLIGFAGLGDPA